MRLEPWADTPSYLELLRRNNSPEMMRHLGGPETEEQVLTRHRRYAELPGRGGGRMYRIVLAREAEVAGAIGFWERERHGEDVLRDGLGRAAAVSGPGIAAAAATGRSRGPRPRRASTAICTPIRPSATPRPTGCAARPGSRCSASATSSTRPAPSRGATTGGWSCVVHRETGVPRHDVGPQHQVLVVVPAVLAAEGDRVGGRQRGEPLPQRGGVALVASAESRSAP